VALTFYYGSGSPFAWRVWLALEFKGIQHELRMITFSEREHKQPAFLALNPRGRVPVIVDDGFALCESAAILEYLDERFAQGPRLFPDTVQARARVRRLIQEADHDFVAAMDPLLDGVLFTAREKWNDTAIAAAVSRFSTELAFWESIIESPFLGGEHPGAADFTLYPHIALALRVQKRKPDVEIRGLIGPKLGAWMQRVEGLPFLERTIPPHWRI